MRRALIHLRLPFSVVLAPLFLWGLYLGGGRLDLRTAAAFLLIHTLLYGGMNAYNSYWDRDEGPIGALAEPPPVDGTVGAVALACKSLALIGGLALGPAFGALVALAITLSVLYSHGRFRWKERPWLAGATIFVGQGLLGVLWGMAATGAPLWPVKPLDVVGALGAALLTTGFYPLTGVYQITADAERAMRTLAVNLGVAGCFAFAAGGAALGGAAIAAVLSARAEYGAVAAGAVYMVLAWTGARRWYGRIRHQTPRQNQGDLMRLAYSGGLFFSGLFTFLLTR